MFSFLLREYQMVNFATKKVKQKTHQEMRTECKRVFTDIPTLLPKRSLECYGGKT